jgi:hypothetical protein
MSTTSGQSGPIGRPLARQRQLDPLNGPDSHAVHRRDLHDANLAQTQIGADRGFLLGVDRPPAERLPLRLGAFQARHEALADHRALELGEDAIICSIRRWSSSQRGFAETLSDCG